ncbi:MAG TPA: inositol monophosphatase family protein [Pirellulaceae bacterium]|nr:inositol monophosphatase family protein [Pirellulaceae bacterium]HMO92747.1 inositol monophosphatase family protein [Pirellulaceae bacterium]HMP70299.1 inositol monophosphatase family protein [Pirellulaceae bacterium]
MAKVVVEVHDFETFGEICREAARVGGNVLMACRQSLAVHEKGPNDWVTNADVASQKAIEELILSKVPSHLFVGEETSSALSRLLPASSPTNSAYHWVVDPLDGTVNYIHGLPSYAVSVALLYGTELLVGAVFDPILDELYFASQVEAASLNGKRIIPSDCRESSLALTVFSLPSKIDRKALIIEQVFRLMEHSQSTRRLGSAALNLCYVASGRIDAYFATTLNAWDVAAGALIVRQAGGVIRHPHDQEFSILEPRVLATSTNELWQQLHQLLQVERVDR